MKERKEIFAKYMELNKKMLELANKRPVTKEDNEKLFTVIDQLKILDWVLF